MSLQLSRGGAITAIRDAAIHSLHHKVKIGDHETVYCRECLQIYPCRTIKIYGEEENEE